MTIKRKDNLHINVPAGHSWLDVEEVLIKSSLCAQRSNKNDIYIFFNFIKRQDFSQDFVTVLLFFSSPR